jgi:transmembrane sensor
VQFAAGHRDLRLARGEAHFRVAHDAHSPFRVFVGGRTVQAVGTEFSVRLREGGGVDVLVTNGKVRVGDANGADAQAQFVAAQQVLQLDGAGRGAVSSIAAAEVHRHLAWQRGMLIFQGEPLQAVLAEFRRYTTQDLAIADTGLAGLRVGGYFRAGDVDALLIALRQNFNIASSRDERGRILLTAAR